MLITLLWEVRIALCTQLLDKEGKAVNVTCFSFLSGDVNNFVVGSEDRSVYTACGHGR